MGKKFFACGVFVLSIVLGLHNATLYAPNHGFDGAGHVYYIDYLVKNRSMPPPTQWETHQAPLYYVIGAVLSSFFHTLRAAQYINTVVLWMIIAMVGLALNKIFKDKDQVLLGMLALAALPMLNIFPAMITNELLSTFWIISAATASIYLVHAHTKKQAVWTSLWIAASLAFGVLTKISIITILPTISIAYVIALVRSPKHRPLLIVTGLLAFLLFALAATPILLRGAQSNGPSNVVQTAGRIKQAPRDLAFYTRLDWIPKVDMYTTQYYSLLGGAWNSFWSDGQNAITPFVAFHKKALVLWLLGFVLLPLSLFGLSKLIRKDRYTSIVIHTIGITMLAMYIVYNMISNHYSAVRLTYEMVIVVPYAFGIAAAAYTKRMKVIILILLAIQFATLVSFYWILPWWHVTK